MNNLVWLLRAKRWVQNPPSAGRVKFVLAVIAICVAIIVFEKLVGLPAWMQIDTGRFRGRF